MKTKTYTVVRIVREEYEVEATSKYLAASMAQNPYAVRVIRESVKIKK